MFIKTVAAVAALSLIGGVANAAPEGLGNELEDNFYIYTEVESGWEGSDYEGSSINTRIGYERDITEQTQVYIELGPAIGLEDGASGADTRLEVEVGGDVQITENLELYGEFEMRTGWLNDYKTKFGIQYNFG
jgi:outer membrane autotransporter protein